MPMPYSALLALAAQAAATTHPPSGPAACDSPVLLLVTVDRSDRVGSRRYRDALRASGLIQRSGGSPVAAGPPLTVLEGEWPSDRDVVVQRYPCREAVERMWNSAEYRERLRPLRRDTGRYSVVVLPAVSAAGRP